MPANTPLREAQDRLSIKTIYLRESKTTFGEKFDPMLPGQKLAVQFQFGTERADIRETQKDGSGSIERTMRFFFRAGMRYLLNSEDQSAQTEPAPEQIAAGIEALFCAEYVVSSDLSIPTEPSVKVFGDLNVPYHVWPYWREYCQSTILRCNLPHAMVPMLRVDGTAEPDAQKVVIKPKRVHAKKRTKRAA